MKNELMVVKQENEEMREHGTFNWWKKKCNEVKDEKDDISKRMYEALGIMLGKKRDCMKRKSVKPSSGVKMLID